MKTFLILLLVSASAAFAAPTKEELLDALKEDPTNPSALYNLGLLNFLNDDFGEAAKHWKTLKKLEPTDWKLRAKLIQAYWGDGKKKIANQEIAELRKARKSGKHPDLAEKKFFICDQFAVGEIRAFALEYYELKGERPLAWKFILRSGDDSLDHYISVGSYPSTTEFARAEGSIGPNEKRFHMDGYWKDGSHKTYGFYRNRPDYQVVRKQVRRILAGKQKAISSTAVEKEESAPKDKTNPKPPSK